MFDLILGSATHRPPCLQSLAAEVVALEEQLLQLKSSHLRDKSQASGASEVARVMQVQQGSLLVLHHSAFMITHARDTASGCHCPRLLDQQS